MFEDMQGCVFQELSRTAVILSHRDICLQMIWVVMGFGGGGVGEVSAGISWVEARDAAKHPTMLKVAP